MDKLSEKEIQTLIMNFNKNPSSIDTVTVGRLLATCLALQESVNITKKSLLVSLEISLNLAKIVEEHTNNNYTEGM